jgi:competence/damage-inducible protein CinA-like protein
MPAAEVVAIGTELLLGEIQDTNTRYLARTLRDLGVDFYRATIIGDNTERIAQVIQEALRRCQIVITTGGLGPTVDDPTRAAVAMALDLDLEFRPDLWEQIKARFQRYGREPSDNNRRQAWIPEGAIALENPVGTAPAFACETINACVISLPGVPREMEYLVQNKVIPYLRERFQLSGTIIARVLHVAGVGESTIDEWIGDLETSSNPTVGLLAHPGQVDVRITAKADTVDAAMQMIAEMETQVRARIPEGLYGADQETLEESVILALQDRGWNAVLLESGMSGVLRSALEKARFPEERIIVVDEGLSIEEIKERLARVREDCSADVAYGACLKTGEEKHILHVVIQTPDGETVITRMYGGAAPLLPLWSLNTGLELLRRSLVDAHEKRETKA